MTILWLGYGIVWPLGEGANVISPDVEGVLYGILDILGCVIFGAMVASAASRHSTEGWTGTAHDGIL
jgi:bacteriorhodopsin